MVPMKFRIGVNNGRWVSSELTVPYLTCLARHVEKVEGMPSTLSQGHCRQTVYLCTGNDGGSVLSVGTRPAISAISDHPTCLADAGTHRSNVHGN